MTTEPPISPAQHMMNEVFSFIGRFIAYPSVDAQVAHALWVVHTHLMDRWETTPRLAFLSAEPGSGKSRALEITELLVPNPICTVNGSPAYFFRKVASQEGVTLLLDEIDTIFGPKARENEELRGFLNAGHRRGAMAGRCVIRGKEVQTEEFPAYAAVAMAGLGWLPDTILSRSVIVRMRRRHRGETVEQFRRRIHESEGVSFRSQIAEWATSANIEWPELPSEIQDRDADVWEPLIAVADAIGSEWPTLAREAAIALTQTAKEAEPSLGIQLLTDLRGVFGEQDHVSTRMILAELCALEEAPWADMRGKPLDSRGLAKLLKEYSIGSVTVRIGNTTVKGYRRADLIDVWRRYLSQDEDTDTNVTNDPVECVPSNVADVSEASDHHCDEGEPENPFASA